MLLTVTGGGNFNRLEWCLTGFSSIRLGFLPFVINEYFVGIYFKVM
jgi:hypothetical protein